MKLYFSLNNFEETKNLIDEIKKQNFENLRIDEHTYLSFIEIEDNNYSSFFTKSIYNGALEFCICIFKQKKEILYIPLHLIQTIYSME